MKIGIIGANGKLGALLVEEALKRKHDVTAIIREDFCNNKKVKNTIVKSLFDLTREDISSLDVLISAFGSGLNVDPTINREAINHLSEITSKTHIYLLYVGGAGSLYTNHLHKQRVYETKEHPDFLREISKNIFLGYQDLKEKQNVNYVFVCPSLFFDFDGERKGIYQVGTEEEVIYSSKKESKISYRDFAKAIIDESEDKRYNRKCITICEV